MIYHPSSEPEVFCWVRNVTQPCLIHKLKYVGQDPMGCRCSSGPVLLESHYCWLLVLWRTDIGLYNEREAFGCINFVLLYLYLSILIIIVSLFGFFDKELKQLCPTDTFIPYSHVARPERPPVTILVSNIFWGFPQLVVIIYGL